MVAWVLFGASAALLLVAIHPFVVYPLTLRVLRRLRPRPIAGLDDPVDAPPAFAVCLCAYNEAAVIRGTIDNLLALRRQTGNVQILVYVDAATDGTTEILREYGERIDLVVSAERRGKTHGINQLVPLARAPIIVLIDANVRIEAGALRALARYFRDPQVGCVCGHLTYVTSIDTTTAAIGSVYWRLEEHIKQLESDTGSVMGADGSLYAIRRELHGTVPGDMIDDMYISLRVLGEGYRIVRAADVRAFEPSIPDPREEFRRKIRIACQAFGAHLELWPMLRRLDAVTIYKYVSHKLIRWLTIVWIAAAGLLALAGLAVVAGLPVAAGVAGAGTLLVVLEPHLRLAPLTAAVGALRSFLATGIGVWRALKGERPRTWTPASSIRTADAVPGMEPPARV